MKYDKQTTLCLINTYVWQVYMGTRASSRLVELYRGHYVASSGSETEIAVYSST